MKNKKEIQMPFLTDSKPMMLEAIITSKRVSAIENILHEFDVFSIQKLFLRVFNQIERQFLLEHWNELNIRQQLASKALHEPLPENWFREND